MLIKTRMNQNIMDLLLQEIPLNLNVIGVIENIPEAEIYVDDVNFPKGVLVKKDYFHYLYTKEEDFIDELSSFFKEGYYGFSGVDAELTEKIKARFLSNWNSPCELYYLPEGTNLPDLQEGHTQSIDIKDAGTVDEFYTYRYPGSIEKIKSAIMNRPSSAVYVNGEIVCWCLIHEDNSMGIMYTKESYRKNGYGIHVTLDLARKMQEKGKIPYLQIVKGNSMSPGLAKKCGFEKKGEVEWFGIMVGRPKELIDGNKEFMNKAKEGLLPQHKELRGDAVAELFHFPYNFEGTASEDFKLEIVKDKAHALVWYNLYLKNKQEDISANESNIEDLILNSDYTLFLGTRKGKPVSTAAFLKVEDEVYGLLCLSLEADENKEKIIISTLNLTLKYAKEIKVEVLFTQAPQEMKYIYHQLGFHDLTQSDCQ